MILIDYLPVRLKFNCIFNFYHCYVMSASMQIGTYNLTFKAVCCTTAQGLLHNIILLIGRSYSHCLKVAPRGV